MTIQKPINIINNVRKMTANSGHWENDVGLPVVGVTVVETVVEGRRKKELYNTNSVLASEKSLEDVNFSVREGVVETVVEGTRKKEL